MCQTPQRTTLAAPPALGSGSGSLAMESASGVWLCLALSSAPVDRRLSMSTCRTVYPAFSLLHHHSLLRYLSSPSLPSRRNCFVAGFLASVHPSC